MTYSRFGPSARLLFTTRNTVNNYGSGARRPEGERFNRAVQRSHTYRRWSVAATTTARALGGRTFNVVRTTHAEYGGNRVVNSILRLITDNYSGVHDRRGPRTYTTGEVWIFFYFVDKRNGHSAHHNARAYHNGASAHMYNENTHTLVYISFFLSCEHNASFTPDIVL